MVNNSQINGATGTAKIYGEIEGNDGLIARIMLKTLTGLVQDVTLSTNNGKWEILNIPAGTYDLFLDATNVFNPSIYQVVTGTKTQVIQLEEDQVLEINLTFNKL